MFTKTQRSKATKSKDFIVSGADYFTPLLSILRGFAC